MPQPQDWTLEGLTSYMGSPESVRLEFKESRLLTESKEKIGDNLSREVSAFANTEGGTLIIGIRERREGKNSRVAECFDDGVDTAQIGREQLQQLIESNVHPYLPGIRVVRIPLDEHDLGRCVFVVNVPQGNTAYQARDCCYYWRSEFQVKALQDHEVRIRMTRTQTALARLQIAGVSVLAGRVLNPRFRNNPSLLNQVSSAEDRHGDGYSFETMVHNCGLLTIRDFLLKVEGRGV